MSGSPSGGLMDDGATSVGGRRRRARRGVSVLETMILLIFLCIVLGLAARLMLTLARLDRSGRAGVVDDATIGRLGRDLRDDAHAAASSEAGPEGRSLRLDLGGGRSIAYRVEDGRIDRVEVGGASPAARRSYRLAGCGVARFSADGSARVALTIPGRSPSTAARVVAAIGRDRRFEAGSGVGR